MEELAMSYDGGDKSSIWSKIVGNTAKSVLAIYRMTSNIHSSFNPHLMVFTILIYVLLWMLINKYLLRCLARTWWSVSAK